MLAHWIGAFIVGILLGKSGLFPYLQNLATALPAGIILIPPAVCASHLLPFVRRRASNYRAVVLALCACVWGFVHAAPEYAGPCVEVTHVRASALQFGRAPTIVAFSGRHYEVVKTHGVSRIGGYHVGQGFLWPRVRASHCGGAPRAAFHPYTNRMLSRYIEAGGEPELLPWIGATVFGSRQGLSLRTERTFRESGLVHILVVSGMHVSLFALFVRVALMLPFIPLYSLTFLSASIWRRLLFWSELLSLPFVCFYVWVIGSPNPAQRAAAFYVVWVLGKLFFGLRLPTERFAVCLVVQTLLFPVGFLGAGNVMSWLATLFVVAGLRFRDGGPWADFLSIFDWRLQVRIMVIAAAMFAELAPLSIPGNLLLAPAFGALLQTTYLVVLFPGPILSSVLYFQADTFLRFVEICANLSDIPGLGILSWRPISAVARVFAVGAGAVLVLNSLKLLSIRVSEAKPFAEEAASRIKPS